MVEPAARHAEIATDLRRSQLTNEFERALQASDRENLVRILEVLKPKERAVIENSYGLRDGRVHSLKELAEELNMSREGIRHIETRALRKLRHE